MQRNIILGLGVMCIATDSACSYNNVPWSQKKKWRLLWILILGTPHIGANVTVTLSLVPITMHLPPSLQVSQSATPCMMTQKRSSACNTPYDLRCVASYQPPPSYFYPTGKTRASMPTEHWCEMTQNTTPRLASSPDKTHVCNANLVEGCTM